MLLKHLIEGGSLGMATIFALWLTNIVLIGILVSRWMNRSKLELKRTRSISELILFLGSFAFLIGVFWQIIGFIQTLKVIAVAGDISMGLIAAGLKVSLIAPVYGFILFLISYVIWFINRRMTS